MGLDPDMRRPVAFGMTSEVRLTRGMSVGQATPKELQRGCSGSLTSRVCASRWTAGHWKGALRSRRAGCFSERLEKSPHDRMGMSQLTPSTHARTGELPDLQHDQLQRGGDLVVWPTVPAFGAAPRAVPTPPARFQG